MQKLSLLHSVYQAHQSVHSAWIRRRFARDIAGVQHFLLFVGYPRSGHSLLGAMLNAHPDVVVSHELIANELIEQGCSREELYSRILARAYWFNMRGNQANYSYRIPGSWQGKFRRLRVIGDKRGGAISRHIRAHPDFLNRVRDLVGVPLRLVHAVRNPFDNISAISISDLRPLEESMRWYFKHCDTTTRLESLSDEEERTTVYHEDMFVAPEEQITRLCRFLAMEPDAAWLKECCRVIFPAPTHTRRKVKWTPQLVREVQERIRDIPFLAHYRFDDDKE
jgi:hypothetical protein